MIKLTKNLIMGLPLLYSSGSGFGGHKGEAAGLSIEYVWDETTNLKPQTLNSPSFFLSNAETLHSHPVIPQVTSCHQVQGIIFPCPVLEAYYPNWQRVLKIVPPHDLGERMSIGIDLPRQLFSCQQNRAFAPTSTSSGKVIKVPRKTMPG